MLRRHSIRTQLLILVSAALLPAAGLIGYNILHAARGSLEQANDKVRILADGKAAEHAMVLGDIEGMLARLAERALVRAMDPASCEPQVRELVYLHEEFTTINLRDTQGNSVCSFFDKPASASAVTPLPWFQEGLHSGRFTVGDTYLGRTTGRWVSVVTYPVRDDEGRVTGLLALGLDLERLQPRVMHGIPKDAVVTVVDRNNRILLRSADHAGWVAKEAANAVLTEEARGKGYGFKRARGVDGAIRIHAYRVVPGTGWLAVAGIPESVVFVRHQKLLMRNVALALLALLAAWALAWRFGRSIAAPMLTFEQTARAVADGDLAARAAEDGPAEIATVAHEFNRMLDTRARDEERLRKSEADLGEAQRIAQMGSWQWDLATDAVVCSTELYRLMALDPAQPALKVADLARMYTLETWTRLRAAADHAVASGEPYEIVIEVIRRDGEQRWMVARGEAKRDTNGRVSGVIGTVRDVTAQKLSEARIEHLATHDGLTGLPNRTLILDRTAQAISHAKRTGRQIALMYLDLDRFKVINDGYGHPFGDALLRATGERLAGVVREGDTAARLGGDEFLVLLADLRRSADVCVVAQKVLDALGRPLSLEGREIHVSATIGVSLYPQDGKDPETLVTNADIAMYRAKDLGGNTYELFTNEMSAEIRRRVQLESELRLGLAREELHLAYQPKVELASGRIVGCEALLRWSHPELGAVSPARFIPLAEETGLIVPIGDWVLRTACLQNKAWQAQGLPPIVVSVNLSGRQFLQQDVVAWVQRTLEETGLAPDLLELELTEGLIALDTEKVIATVNRLKSAGVLLAIDDFGTGYSSLSYLKRFRVDRLKIDQSFVRGLHLDPDDAAISLAVIALARSLKLKVTAEGVETAEQCAFLREHRCDEIQGYWFSKPVPAICFEEMLRSGKRLARES